MQSIEDLEMQEEMEEYNSSFFINDYESEYMREFFRQCLPKGRDGDLFQCICGKGMRRNSLTTHWRVRCKFTRGTPELLKLQPLVTPISPQSE